MSTVPRRDAGGYEGMPRLRAEREVCSMFGQAMEDG